MGKYATVVIVICGSCTHWRTRDEHLRAMGFGVTQRKANGNFVGALEYAFCGEKNHGLPCPALTLKTPVTASAKLMDKSDESTSGQQKEGDVADDVAAEIFGEKPTLSIYFESGQDFLKSSDKMALIDMLPRLHSRRIAIHGYTDGTGSVSFNERLAERRAARVKSFLLQAGISQQRVIAKGHALCCYAESNGQEKGRAKNRRVEIYLNEERTTTE